jgi:hypothetical protein
MSTKCHNRLDLTAASRVHLLEPQWNPSSERQVLDRVHRMDQTRRVEAYQYIVTHSIDEVSAAPHQPPQAARTDVCSSMFPPYRTESCNS